MEIVEQIGNAAQSHTDEISEPNGTLGRATRDQYAAEVDQAQES